MKKKIFSFIAVLLLISNLISCQKKDPKITPSVSQITRASTILTATYDNVNYNITTSFVSGQDSSYGVFTGIVNPDNYEVTLEAIPQQDHGFIGWASDINGNNIVSYYNPYKFVVTEDVTLYPVFITNSQIVELKDPILKRDVQTRLNKSTLTYWDLQQITDYEIHNPETLEDFAYFHSMKSLYVYLNPDIDYNISPVANLVNLEDFFLLWSPIDFLPIENYKNLRDLRVNYVGEDISSLVKNKETLEILSLTDLNIKNFEFLSVFSNLKEFYISNSLFTENDFKYLPEFLEKLGISNCTGIRDLSPLTRLLNLKGLDISSCWISDITPIGELKNLESLSLNNNLISDISPLSDLHKLKSLDFENNRVTDLSPLESLINLDFIYLRFNPITDYSYLENLSCKIFSYTDDEIAQAVSAAKKMVDTLIKPEMTDEEKYTALAVGLCEKVTYDGSTGAFSALVLGTSVCDGYTEAYMMLCTMAGLPCYYITGMMRGNEYHTWNIVKIDNNYYHVDTTWMDQSEFGFIGGTYFLKSDNFFLDNFHGDFITVAPDLVCNDLSKDNTREDITYP